MSKRPRASGASEFDNPTFPPDVGGQPSPGVGGGGGGQLAQQPQEFEEPEGVGPPQGESEVPPVEQELSVALTAEQNNLATLKATIEEMLVRQAAPMTEGYAAAAEALAGAGNIQGVGYALGDPDSGAVPGEPSLVVFTAEPSDEAAVKSVIASAASLDLDDEELDRTRVAVVQTGIIEAQPHRFRARPAPCGVSVGHFQITAGTIGCLARGRSGERRNRLFVLSNNHVLANVNAGPLGAAVLQPGPYDGGVNPRDRIGVLERFVNINFNAGASNYVDCATAWVSPAAVRREFVYLVGGQQRFFRVAAVGVTPQVNMLVGKSGRTTQLTAGRITAVGVTVNVNFGGGRVGTFRDQFSVVSTTAGKTFSAGGDSGSLIWTWNARRNPVGLLFAGGGGVTFANRIDRVRQALDIDLYT